MSTAIVSTTLYDLNLYYKNSNNMPSLKTSAHLKAIMDRKIVGTHIPLSNPLVRRNSGSSATTTSPLPSPLTTPSSALVTGSSNNSSSVITTANGILTTNNNNNNNSHKLNNSSMLSLSDVLNSSNNVLLSNGCGGQGHRKLDRSMSEPVDRSNSIIMQQQQRINSQGGMGNGAGGNSSRYKTELCRPYEENGTCKYGDKCQFAHGHHELRNLTRHPKYKTELCRTFHTVGFCPYGPRCHFIHNEDESRKSSCSSSSSSTSSSSSSSDNNNGIESSRDGPPCHRPKALSIGSFSMNSFCESPPSSLSESPTSFGRFFDDPFNAVGGGANIGGGFPSSTPVTPTVTANNAFTFSSQDFTSALMPPQPPTLSSKQQYEKNAYNRALNQITLTHFNQQNRCSNKEMSSSSSSSSSASSLDSVFRGENNHHHHHTSSIVHSSVISTNQDNPDYPNPLSNPSPVGSVVSDLDSLSLSDSPTCTSPLDVSRNLRLPIFSQLSTTDD